MINGKKENDDNIFFFSYNYYHVTYNLLSDILRYDIDQSYRYKYSKIVSLVVTSWSDTREYFMFRNTNGDHAEEIKKQKIK